MSARLQAFVLVGLVALTGWVIVSRVRSSWDVVFLGVIVVILLGAAIGLYPRQFTSRKRTFTRTTRPPR